jgi:hypothetical protein
MIQPQTSRQALNATALIVEHNKAEAWINVFPGAVCLSVIVLFSFSVLFIRRQPLKSRGLIPFIVSFVLFIKIVLDIVLHLTISDCSSIWLTGV